ncbi:carbohydrate ABC transporter permease [Paenibacillus mendelii]|uniref:Carbohydrate ABC transporter permease n=1 Tax=Paenibacillus mendelii TaxID=206163 RepID=A0ABV6JFP2_9BACL|nr:carbohydrate ABC transporter permease [Paenibacillus mendelii]MCQ6557613.1 carbohydrate ABC transporter permease [Paenibacillus mendelii]
MNTTGQQRKFNKIILLILEIILLFYAITLIYPFVWMLINSLKSNKEFFQDIWSLPEQWAWKNYADAWESARIGRFFFNSIWMTAVGTFTSVMSAAMPAYVLAKYKFKGSNAVYGLAIVGFLIPSIGTFGPWYMLMQQLSLFNPAGVLIGYTGGIGFYMLVLYSFFKGISWEYAEAAFMDGAGHFRVFFSIMLPLVRGGLVAVATFALIGIWNDYFQPLILLQSEHQYTIAVGLSYLVEAQKYSADYTVLFAAMWIAVLPILLVYMVMQEKLINGFTMGGIKG